MRAVALWCVAPDQAEIRPADPGAGLAIKTLYSGISRGTERLILKGRVPVSEHDSMRGPGMEGQFPFPVKYGYCNVGRVTEGHLAGRHIFALYPHQTWYRLPEDSLALLPEALPPERAVLAANMETALNVIWDSRAQIGDRIAVIGCGVVGALIGYLLAQLPGAKVTLIDRNPDRAALADSLGVPFAPPDRAPQECDVVIHASASEAGLALALSIAGLNATVVEASWHGEGSVSVPLGHAFHSRRLRLISSQVGHIPADRAARWSYRRRMAKALDLLCDTRLDALISGETEFTRLPDLYPKILSAPETLCHRIRY